MKKLVFTLLTLFFTQIAFAQSLSDIQNIRVDNLSDAQIEQLIKRAEASGMNESQLEAMAIERGMPAGEVSKLRQRIQSIRSGGGRAAASSGGQRQQSGNQLRTVEGFEVDDNLFDSLRKSDPYYDLTPTQKKIFGYKLFHNRELNFNPSLNVPTPPNYTIGAGDQLLIDIYGASQQSYDVTVNPDGRIFVPNVGPIQVGGSTVSAATVRIRSALSRIYSGLGGGNPNTFMDIRLGNIRTVSVSMVGELNRPGTYTLPSFSSPFNALFAAGGPNENGSFRHIQVYRDNKLLTEIDVYEFLTMGASTSPINLRDNDVIIVPPIRNRVEIMGPVRREGLFEMKQGETVQQLIQFAGGFSSSAYQERLTVTRNTGTQRKVEDVDRNLFETYSPLDGDVYRVGEILNRFENRVQMTGAVNRPGTFELVPGLTIAQLIEKAGGLREDAFLNRATLYRTMRDFSLEIVPVDVQAVINGQVNNFVMQKEDVLNIPSIYELREEYFLKITGEVNQPGAYPFGANMTAADLVLIAGGFKESATASNIEIARRVKDDTSGKLAEIIILNVDSNLRITGDQAQVKLQPFDHVIVRKSPGFQREQLITVEGEAVFPGEYAIAHADERISDVLKRAGGLNRFAYPKGATLIRRNEYFVGQTEEEVRATYLEQLRSNIRRDSLDRTESDKILVNSIDRLLADRLAKNSKNNRLLVDDFKRQSIEGLATTDGTLQNVEIKDIELIGINLENILKSPHGPEDLILKEGDVLSIPKELQTVRMRGEVLFPTSARYIPMAGFKQYISRSGGFTERSRRSRSYVVYANGDVSRTRKILFFNNYPKIEPGAEIIVPAKPERQGLTAQAWVGLGTSIATLALLVNNLLN